MEIDQLQLKASRCSQVINGLKESGAWNIVVEDFLEAQKRIDDSWHLITDEKDLTEMRVAKMATKQIVDLVESYQHDLKKINEEIALMADPEAHAKINYGDK